MLSGVYQLPWTSGSRGIFTAASGRPVHPARRADLNGDGTGGALPSDRARANPADEASSVGRNSGTTASYINMTSRVSKRFRFRKCASFEAILDVFNLLNRANFFENTNQSSFTIFGTGRSPGARCRPTASTPRAAAAAGAVGGEIRSRRWPSDAKSADRCSLGEGGQACSRGSPEGLRYDGRSQHGRKVNARTPITNQMTAKSRR